MNLDLYDFNGCYCGSNHYFILCTGVLKAQEYNYLLICCKCMTTTAVVGNGIHL